MEKNYLDCCIEEGRKHMWMVIFSLTLVISVSACAAAVLMQFGEHEQSEVCPWKAFCRGGELPPRCRLARFCSKATLGSAAVRRPPFDARLCRRLRRTADKVIATGREGELQSHD